MRRDDEASVASFGGVYAQGAGDEWINLAALWRAAGADPYMTPRRWLSWKSSRELVSYLDSRGEAGGRSLVESRGAGRRPDVWAYRPIATAYAGRLLPEFEIAMNKAYFRLRFEEHILSSQESRGPAGPGPAAGEALPSLPQASGSATSRLDSIGPSMRSDPDRVGAVLNDALFGLFEDICRRKRSQPGKS